MIIRIVKMTFDPARVKDFLEVFEASKVKIRNFEGCSHLELLKDADKDNIYFTYSHWLDQQHLDRYRHSDLFKDTWAKTKILFAAKPEAHSLLSEQEIH